MLDLGDDAAQDERRIISSWWYRFRRTVENRPTSIIVLSEEACTRSCAALTLELNGTPEWSQASGGQTNVVPLRKSAPVKRTTVTQGNLLRLNSIKVRSEEHTSELQ